VEAPEEALWHADTVDFSWARMRGLLTIRLKYDFNQEEANVLRERRGAGYKIRALTSTPTFAQRKEGEGGAAGVAWRARATTLTFSATFERITSSSSTKYTHTSSPAHTSDPGERKDSSFEERHFPSLLALLLVFFAFVSVLVVFSREKVTLLIPTDAPRARLTRVKGEPPPPPARSLARARSTPALKCYASAYRPVDETA